MLQGHTAVRGDLCVVLEGGFDFSATLSCHRRARRVHGYDAGEKLIQAFEVLEPIVVDPSELLERSALKSPTEGLLRGGANVRLVLHRAQRGEKGALGEGLHDDDGPRRLHDAGRLFEGPAHGPLRDVVEGVEKDRAVKRTIRER